MPWWLICPYDVDAPPAEVIDDARTTYPWVLEDGRRRLRRCRLAITPRLTDVLVDEWVTWVAGARPVAMQDTDTFAVAFGPDAIVTNANATLGRRSRCTSTRLSTPSPVSMSSTRGKIGGSSEPMDTEPEVDPGQLIEETAAPTEQPRPAPAHGEPDPTDAEAIAANLVGLSENERSD